MVPSGFCVREQCESEISRVSARSEVLNPPMSSIPSGALLPFPVLPWCQGPERSLPARAAEVNTGNGLKWMTKKNNFKRTLSTHILERVRRVSLEFVGFTFLEDIDIPAKESVSKHWLSSPFLTDKYYYVWHDMTMIMIDYTVAVT